MANGQLWYGTTNGDGGNDERIVRVNNDGTSRTGPVVFLDARIPDLTRLLNGLVPGARGFVLDPFYDGVQQIAEVLVRGGYHDLDSVAIVAHGIPGALSIGSTTLDSDSLFQHGAQLAEIGAALAIDGDLRLYACDVAFGPHGREFVANLSLALGRVAVSASDCKVGSAALGGTWDLDAGIGVVTSAAPFTTAACNSYVGVLAGVLYEIVDYYDQPANTLRYELRHINVDGTNSITQLTGLTNPQEIVIDTANNRYFILSYDIGFQNSAIYSGRLDSTAAPTKVVDFSATPNDAIDSIVGLEIDTVTHHLYVTRTDYKDSTYAQNNATSGIIELTYNPTNGAVTGTNNFLVTAPAAANAPEGYFFANDLARGSDGVIYYTAQSTGDGYGANMVYRFDPTTKIITPLLNQSQFPITTDTSTGDANGLIQDVEIDNGTGLVYFSVDQYEKLSGNNKYIGPGSESQIYVISRTATGATNATVVTLNGFPAAEAAKFVPQNLRLDQINRILYVESEGIAIGDNSDDSAYAFQLSADGLSATYIRTYSPNFTSTQQFGNIQGLEIDTGTLLDLDANNSSGITNGGYQTTYTENGVAVAVTDTDLLITNARGSTLASATITLFNRQSGDLLAVNGSLPSGITASTYNASTGTLTLMGSASSSAYQTAIHQIVFSNSGQNPGSSDRSVTVKVNDGSSDSNIAQATIHVTPVNDAPVIGGIDGDSVPYTQNATAVAIDAGGNATVTDLDSLNFDAGRLEVAVSNVQIGDSLNITSTAGGITVSNGSVSDNGTFFAGVSGQGSGALIFSLAGNASPARVQDLLHAITFASSSNVGGTRTITYTLNDGDGTANSGANTGTASSSVVVTIPNTPPVATASGGTTAATEQVAIAIDTGITLADADNTTLASATVAITEDFQAGQDVLAFANTNATAFGNIAGSYNSTTGILTLTSSGAVATVAQFRAALRTVTYTNTSDAPDIGGSRTISFSANDGIATGAASTKTVSVLTFNDGPTVTVPVSVTATEDLASAVTGISFADVDAGTAPVTATLSVGSGSLAATTEPGIIVGGGPTALRLVGSIANINAFIAAGKVAFTTAQNATASVTLTAAIDDGGSTGAGGALTASATTTINVTAVNDAPVVTAGGTVTFTEKGAAVIVAPAATVTDVDSTDFAGGSLTAAVTDAVASDQLAILNQGTGPGQIGVTGANVTFEGTAIGTVTSGGTNGTSLVVSFNADATQAAVTALMRDVTYATTSNDPAAARTVTFTVNDGDGGTATGSATSTVQVTPVNDPPTLTTAGANATFTEGAGAGTQGAAVALFSGTTVSTVESGQSITGLTFTVAGLKDGANEVVTVDGIAIGLAAGASGTTTGNGLTYTVTLSSDATTATVSLTKSAGVSASVAAAVVDGLRYQDTNLDNPSAGARTVTLTQIVDSGGDTAAASLASAATVTVTPVNDAPVLALSPGVSLVYSENAPPAQIASDLTLNDPDSTTLTGATVVLSGGSGTVADVLGFVGNADTGAISGAYDTTTRTLALSGSGTAAEYRSALAAVTYANTSDDPGTATRTATFTVTDGMATSTPVTRAIAVTAVNDAPTVAVPGAAPFTTPGMPIALTGITFADIDAQGGTETATFTVGSGTLIATAANGVTLAGTGTGMVTATGTLTDLNGFITGNHLSFQGAASTTLNVSLNDLGHTGDGGAQSGSASRTITVDQPPTAPVDSDGASGGSVTEGATVGTVVGITAQSTDADTNDTVRYALTANPNGFFAIDATTGVVTVSAAGATGLNYETATNHTITVSATDSFDVASTSNFTIAVANAAPSTPIDTNTAANTVTEGAAVGTLAGVTALSTDPNGPAVTYSLTADSSNGGFRIDATTGEITVSDGSKIDYESSGTNHAYTVTVRSSDGQANTSQDFTIAVTDVAPPLPFDTNNIPNFVPEGAAAGTTVGLTTTSMDVNGGAVTYRLTETANGAFQIDASSGVVTVADASKIDYETSGTNHSYGITVEASDGTLTSSQTFTIGVTNVAPTTPVDTDTSTNTVAEGADVGAAVGITVSSAEVNGPAVIYSLTADSSGGGFAVNASTGVVTVADASKIDYETVPSHSYSITVAASDGTTASPQSFTIGLTNVAPTGLAEAYTLGEDGTLTVPVDTGVLANDTDPNGGTLTAVLGTGPAHGSVALNANGSFTYTPTANYNGTDSFTYSPTDGTQPGAPVTVSLTVGSINDAPQGAAKTVTTAEDTPYAFKTADFGFSDPADAGSTAGANTLFSVIVATVPGAGTLTNNGAAVAAGTEILVADIEAGHLVFTPAADASGTGYAAFTFRVRDNGASANGGIDTDPTPRTLTVDVSPVNDAPVVSGDGTIAVLQGGRVALTTADLTATDVDNTASELIYTVTASSRGSIVIGGNAVTSFTQAQLAAGSVGFLQDGSASAAAGFTVTVSDGSLSSAAKTVTAAVDLIPIVTGIAYGTNDGTLKAGESVILTVSLSEAVTVTGTPALALNDGGTAVYVSGSGTAALVFSHTVAAGQNTADLAVTGLVYDSGTIRDAANQRVAALSTGGLNPDGVLVVDTTAPTFAFAGVSGAANHETGHILSGTLDVADAGLTVTVRDGAAVIGTTTADSRGHFDFAFTDTKEGAIHSYALNAVATDAAGNQGVSDSFLFNFDYNPNRDLFGTVAHDASSHVGQVYALYEGLLDRAPDQGGAQAFVDALDHGVTLTDITQAFLTSAEGSARLNAASNADYVEQIYAAVLGRASDAGGKQGWVNALDQGASRADVADSFVFSTEHLAQLKGAYDAGVFVADAGEAGVARLYHGLLDRAPDGGGLAAYDAAVHAGSSLTSIAQAFIGSGEYASTHGSQTDKQFVDSLYVNGLGRTADSGGEQGWLNQLSHGATRADVAVGILQSQEAQAHLVGFVEQGYHLV